MSQIFKEHELFLKKKKMKISYIWDICLLALKSTYTRALMHFNYTMLEHSCVQAHLIN